MSYGGVLLAFLSVLQTCAPFGQNIKQSSLTLVIDTSIRMKPEINILNKYVDKILDIVDRSKETPIKNVVLVNYNNSNVMIPIVTENRKEFNSYLSRVMHEASGSYCSEAALNGIKFGLENSRQNSLLYVITDATANDFKMYEEVRHIARKKQIQMSFVSTFNCKIENYMEYEVFYKLAKDTYGQVYKIYQKNLYDMLDYVMENIESRRTVLAYKTFPTGQGNKFDVLVDSKTEDIIVSVSGLNSIIKITYQNGTAVESKTLVDASEVKIIRILDTKVNSFKIEVGSSSQTTIKVTGKTTVHIQCGFSFHLPSSLIETNPRPISDEKVFLSIQLYGEDVNLTNAKVLDTDGNVLENLPLKSVNQTHNFFWSQFYPPQTAFRIVAYGYDVKTKTEIIRESATPIETKNEQIEIPVNVEPLITIEGWPKLNPEYNAHTILKCKVYGYPKPDIYWQNVDTKDIYEYPPETLDEPYLYLSKLDLGIPKKNFTYKCEAVGTIATKQELVNVEIDKYFEPIEVPKGKHILKFGAEVNIVCKIDANPPAAISWYKNNKLLRSDDNIVISDDNTTIKIKNNNSNKSQGNYICNANNKYVSRNFSTKLVSDKYKIVPPLIDKQLENKFSSSGEDVRIPCLVIAGMPKPTIFWSYQGKDDLDFRNLSDINGDLYLKNVTPDKAGSYRCTASNIGGKAYYTVELIVRYSPIIVVPKEYIENKVGKYLTITCKVDGVPKPTVTWYDEKNNKIAKNIKNSRNFIIRDNNNLSFKPISLNETGNYTCEASNELGKVQKNVYVYLYIPAYIIPPNITSIALTADRNYLLPCNAGGFPKPEINWAFRGYKRTSQWLRHNETGHNIIRVKPADEGYYTCTASNKYKLISLTYEITVNAPPTISNYYSDRNFQMVEGDVGLTIHCNATGNPTPEITWKHNDEIVNDIGSGLYTINKGSLIISSIDEASRGSYSCVATNQINSTTLTYTLCVNKYPMPDVIDHERTFLTGKKVSISCGPRLNENDVDDIRWYKNGKNLSKKGMILSFKNISTNDSGIYTCRVSNIENSYSIHIKVTAKQRTDVVGN